MTLRNLLIYLAILVAAILSSSCKTTKNTASDSEDDSHNHTADHHHHEQHRGDEQHHHDHDTEDHHDHEHHHHEETTTVTLSETAVRRSNIQLAPALSGALTGSIDVPAELQFNPDRVAHVSPIVGGHLLGVNVSIGDKVTVNQSLASLRSVELGQARAELKRTSSLANVTRRNRDRLRQLHSEGISSEKSVIEAEAEFEQASAENKAAVARLKVFGIGSGSGPDMELKSPIDGIVIQRHATRGENVSPDETLFIVADLSKIWAIGRVYEQQISAVSNGMDATLTLTAYPSRSWSGTVDWVGETIDEATRSLPVRVEFDNPDSILRPGLFGSLRLSKRGAAEKEKTVLVPNLAVQTFKNRTIVFVPVDKTTFRSIPVTLGRQGKSQTEILRGLKPGDTIVTQGSFILKSELLRGELGHGHAH